MSDRTVSRRRFLAGAAAALAAGPALLAATSPILAPVGPLLANPFETQAGFEAWFAEEFRRQLSEAIDRDFENCCLTGTGYHP
jgi:ABC-type sugar transport system substrate-binding protein